MSYLPASSLIDLRYCTKITYIVLFLTITSLFIVFLIWIPSLPHLANMCSSFRTQVLRTP